MNRKSKKYANKGVNRNKKPLQNIMYKVKPNIALKDTISNDIKDRLTRDFYLNENVGYVEILWKYQKSSTWGWSADLTLKLLKEKLNNKQWSKLCQCKTFEFTVQRRINKRNV